MTPEQALAFVHKHGVVLASSTGPVPAMAAAVVGAPVSGSWWSPPERPGDLPRPTGCE